LSRIKGGRGSYNLTVLLYSTSDRISNQREVNVTRARFSVEAGIGPSPRTVNPNSGNIVESSMCSQSECMPRKWRMVIASCYVDGTGWCGTVSVASESINVKLEGIGSLEKRSICRIVIVFARHMPRVPAMEGQGDTFDMEQKVVKGTRGFKVWGCYSLSLAAGACAVTCTDGRKYNNASFQFAGARRTLHIQSK
jgi:hypothetical protein